MFQNILVPVDFSDSSIAAFKYAINLSIETNSKILVLHVIDDMAMVNGEASIIPIEIAKDSAKASMEQLISKTASQYPTVLKMDTIIEYGTAEHQIASIAEKNHIDLIVMGMKKDYDLLDKIIGSVSKEVTNLVTCPILLIHKDIVYEEIKKIAFAFDDRLDIADSLHAYKRMNSYFKASTYFLHIIEESPEEAAEVTDKIINELFVKSDVPYHFEVTTMTNPNPEGGIHKFCHDNDIDLLILTHRKRGIWAALFFESLSAAISVKASIPVLIFPQKLAK